jgi:hypothetical protein
MAVDDDKQFESQIKEAKSLEELSLLLQKLLKGYEVCGVTQSKLDRYLCSFCL